MKYFTRFNLRVLLIAASTIGLAIEATSAPDLAFSGIGISSRTARTVTLKYWVTNYGNSDAPVLKISAEARRPGGPFYAVAQTKVPGTTSRSDGWYMWTDWVLRPSAAAGFYSKVTFPSTWVGSVELRLKVDSCSGDEFMPTYCRANESNESNNFSRVLTVVLN